MAPEAGPHRLPNRALTHKEQTQHWARDRRDLVTTAGRKNDLSAFVKEQCQ
jgi:hypothetical protein